MGQVERHKRTTWLQAAWVASDLVAIGGGFVLGYWARFHSPLTALFPPSKGIPPIAPYLIGALVTAALWIPLFHSMGLYRIERGRMRPRLGDTVRALWLGALLMAALGFFYRGASFSRLAVPIIWGFATLLIVFGRAAVSRLARPLARHKPIRFALVGEHSVGARLVQAFEQSSYPHEYVGCFIERPEGDAGSPQLAPVLGPISEIRTLAPGLALDLIVLTPAMGEEGLVDRVHRQCQELDLDLQFVPALFSIWGRSVRADDIDGLPVLRLRELPLSGWPGVAKRALDLCVSGILLVVLSPVLLLIALAVRLESPGPILHRQERIGRDRRTFPMLKFRSMRVDAEKESGPVWASEGDPRRTRVGVFLRKWSLDELPQLWNVFVGHMSLVGPRPERAFFVHQFETNVQDYYDRHRVKSGVTGWAQVHGLRGNVPIEERTRYDLYYVEHWSFWLDLRILFLTAWAVVRHRGE